ncbi:hypothetical protein JOM56_010118 [Amanita muscaria]
MPTPGLFLSRPSAVVGRPDPYTARVAALFPTSQELNRQQGPASFDKDRRIPDTGQEGTSQSSITTPIALHKIHTVDDNTPSRQELESPRKSVQDLPFTKVAEDKTYLLTPQMASARLGGTDASSASIPIILPTGSMPPLQNINLPVFQPIQQQDPVAHDEGCAHMPTPQATSAGSGGTEEKSYPSTLIASPALPAFDEPARSLQDQGTEYAALHGIHDPVGQQGPTADSKDHTHMSVSQITSQLADADTNSPSTPTVTLVLPAVGETSRPLEAQGTGSPTSQELFGQQGRAAHDHNLPIPQIISADTNENSFSTPIVFPASPVINDSKVTSRPELPIRQRNPFNGREKSLVIAIDIGTTFSGVSYALLEPEKVPQIRSVARSEAVSN